MGELGASDTELSDLGRFILLLKIDPLVFLVDWDLMPIFSKLFGSVHFNSKSLALKLFIVQEPQGSLRIDLPLVSNKCWRFNPIELLSRIGSFQTVNLPILGKKIVDFELRGFYAQVLDDQVASGVDR